MKRHRPKLLLFSAVLGIGVCMLGAWSALEVTRVVDVISMTAGAFGSGAGFVAAMYERRSALRR
jgi:uncharacterized membrane protein